MSGEESRNFPRLNLPAVSLKTVTEDGRLKVLDTLRRKYVALTPEEFVRQHFTAWLHNEFHYPYSIMANEVGIDVNGLRRRCDTVVFRPDGTPLMIVEYKAPEVSITQDTFDQIVRYNMALKARYLVVSNGLRHYCCVIDYDTKTYQFIPEIPEYGILGLSHSAN